MTDGRLVLLSALTPTERDRTLIALHTLCQDLRRLLEEHATVSPTLARKLARFADEHAHSLSFLEVRYERDLGARREEREAAIAAARNDRVWEAAERGPPLSGRR